MGFFVDVERIGPFAFLTPQVVIVHEVDWLVEDFVLSCEQRIMKRFQEMGVRFFIPPGLPELPHTPRRPRTIWGTLGF